MTENSIKKLELTPQQRMVFENIQNTLPLVSISTGTYALDSNGAACGLHSVNATHFDLAGLLWKSCELFTCDSRARVDERDHQNLFRECWQVLRSHFNWDSKQTSSDAALCRWLDRHTSKAWYNTVLEQVLSGVPFETVRATPQRQAVSSDTDSKQTLIDRMAEYQ